MNSPAFENRSAATAEVDRQAYPFRDHWINLAPGGMHFVDEGAGQTLLFVHGTPSWSFEWRNLITALAPDFRCVAPDLIGFGLSERPQNFPYTPEAHAEALQEFVRKMDLRDVTLVVHDFGGPIALPLCLGEEGRVKRVVIFNTWMWGLNDDPGIARAGRLVGTRVGRFLYEWANLSLRFLMPSAYGDRHKLTPAIHKQYLDRFPDRDGRGRVLWTLARSLLGSTDYYESLWEMRERLTRFPILILWGMKDAAFGPHHLSRWRDALPAARVVELAAAGHWPQEEEPEKVIQELRSFISDDAGPEDQK